MIRFFRSGSLPRGSGLGLWIPLGLCLAGSLRAQDSRPAVVRDESPTDPVVKYMVSLPQPFDHKGSYEVLILLNPRGHYEGYMRQVAPVAARSGWLVVCPDIVCGEVPLPLMASRMRSLLSHLRKKYAARDDRFFLGGFSLGGHASFVLSHYFQGELGGVISNSGHLKPGARSREEVKPYPVPMAVMMSGDLDTVSTPRYLEYDVGVLQEAGIPTRLITYDGGHHVAPVQTYLDAISWVEAQLAGSVEEADPGGSGREE